MPVFVDDSGRRHRIVRAFGWAVAVVVVLYLGLLGVSLVGSPDVVPLSLPAIGHLLPGPGAPLIGTPLHTHGSSGDVLATVPRHVTATAGGASSTATAATTGSAPRTATVSNAGTPTIAATPVATSQPVHGKSTAATSRTPTTTTSPTTPAQPRPSQSPPATSKASTHSAHWRAYTTSPSPSPAP